MRKRFLFLLTFFCALTGWAQNELYTTPYMPLNKPLAAHYAGIVNGELWIYGGYNYERDPRFQDSSKPLYNPQGYGASVAVPQGAVLIGGSDGVNQFPQVLLYKNIDHRDYHTFASQYDHTGRVQLPSLPASLQREAAATDGCYIYVAGGLNQVRPSRAVYRLAWPDGKHWRRLCTLPDTARIQPVAVVQKDATGPCLYVFGGYKPDGHVYKDGLKLNLRTLQWTRLTWPSLPEGQKLPSVGTTAGVLGCSSIFFVGGREGDIYQQDVLVYNTLTDAWSTLPGDPNLARVDATLTPQANYWYYAGGETQPKKLTSDVTVVQILYEPLFGALNWCILGLYLLVMLGLGVYFMRRRPDTADFYLGGGSFPAWVAGVSIFVTLLGAAIVTVPTASFVGGWQGLLVPVIMLILAYPAIRYAVPAFRDLSAPSAYAYLQERFSRPLRLVASALSILFMLARVALVLYLPSLAMAAVVGIDIRLCIVLMGLVAVLYSMMGGMRAIVWGNVLQFGLLLVSLLVVLCYLMVNTQGSFMDVAQSGDKFQMLDFSLNCHSAAFWVLVLSGLFGGLVTYTADQPVVQRYMITSDQRSASRSVTMYAVLGLVMTVLLLAVGTALYTYFRTNPAAMDFSLSRTESILPYFMSTMPAGVAGLLLASIFAVAMSAMAGNIHSIGTLVSVDFCAASDAGKSLKIARIAGVISGVLGVVLALVLGAAPVYMVFNYCNITLGILMSALAVFFLIGLLSPRKEK